MTQARLEPTISAMSNHIPTTRWALVPKAVPAGGAIVKRYSLVPLSANACASTGTAGTGTASS